MTTDIFIAGGVSFDTVIHLERFLEPRQATLFARDLVARGKKLVVLTRGADGAFAVTENGDRFDVEAVTAFGLTDTKGAGDAFFAGFLHGFRQEQAVSECLEFATLAAALCVASRELAHPELSAARLAELHPQFFGGKR